MTDEHMKRMQAVDHHTRNEQGDVSAIGTHEAETCD